MKTPPDHETWRLQQCQARRFAPIRWLHVAVAFVAAVLVLTGCTSHPTLAPEMGWSAWQAKRRESVAGSNGWTTLIGLHWLHEGANTAGSSETNDVVLDSAQLPSSIGCFQRTGTNVTFRAAPNVDVRVEGKRIQNIPLVSDLSTSPNPTRLQLGDIAIVLIQRGDRMGLRVRDPQAKARREFSGLRYYPYDPQWRLDGRYLQYPSMKKLRVPDVTGALQEFPSPGELVFQARGVEARLAVAIEPDEPDFFILFRDTTAGKSTYPAGRFLYVKPPAAGDNRITIDFNRAYTPPCGFTPFATCPIPPEQNHLPFAVEAGELKPTGH